MELSEDVCPVDTASSSYFGETDGALVGEHNGQHTAISDHLKTSTPNTIGSHSPTPNLSQTSNISVDTQQTTNTTSAAANLVRNAVTSGVPLFLLPYILESRSEEHSTVFQARAHK